MEMTSAEKHVNKTPQSWEGRDYRPADDNELREVLGRAFDYRGDGLVRILIPFEANSCWVAVSHF